MVASHFQQRKVISSQLSVLSKSARLLAVSNQQEEVSIFMLKADR